MKKLFLFVASVALLASCSQVDETVLDGGNQEDGALLSVKTSVSTIAAQNAKKTKTTTAGDAAETGPVMGTTLAAGAKIGLCVYEGTENTNTLYPTVANGVCKNLLWTLDAEGKATGDPFYLQKTAGTVYAYFPQTGDASNDFVETSVAVAPGYTDYLYGKSGAVSKDKTAATITLNHAMAMVQFTFAHDANYPGDCVVKDITLKAIPNAGTWNILTGAITPATTTGDVILLNYDTNAYTSISTAAYSFKGINTATSIATTEAARHHALVFPNATPGSYSASIEIDDAVYSDVSLAITTGEAEWKAGMIYTYNISLSASALTVTSVTVKPWTTGGSSNIEL